MSDINSDDLIGDYDVPNDNEDVPNPPATSAARLNNPQDYLQTRHGLYLRYNPINASLQNVVENFLANNLTNAPMQSQSILNTFSPPNDANITTQHFSETLSHMHNTGPAISASTPANNANNVSSNNNLSSMPDFSNFFSTSAHYAQFQNLLANSSIVPPSSANLSVPPPAVPSVGNPLMFPYNTIPQYNQTAQTPGTVPRVAAPNFGQNPLLPPIAQPGYCSQKPNVLNSTLLTGNCPVQSNAVSAQTPDGAIEKFHKNCPKFDGYSRKSYEVFSHFDQLETMFHSYQISPPDYFTAASHSFAGAAYAYFRQNTFLSYNDLKSKIIKIYGQMHTSNQLRKEFHSSYQGNDSIQQFINRIRDKVSELRDRDDYLDDRAQLIQLSTGCKKDYQWILNITKPQTFDEAASELINAEDANKNNVLPTVHTNYIGRGRHNNRRRGGRGYRNQGNRNNNYNHNYTTHSHNNNKSNIQCFSCHKYGHMSKYCKSNLKSSSSNRGNQTSNNNRAGSHVGSFRGNRNRSHSPGYRNSNRNYNSNSSFSRGRHRSGRHRGRGRGRGRVHGIHADEFDMDDDSESAIGPDDSASMNQPAMQALSDLLPHLNL